MVAGPTGIGTALRSAPAAVRQEYARLMAERAAAGEAAEVKRAAAYWRSVIATATATHVLVVAEDVGAVDPAVWVLPHLTAVRINHTHLAALPDRFDAALHAGVSVMSLAGNALTCLPPSLACLAPALPSLSLNDNHLSYLPPFIGALTRLTTLHLHNNALEELTPAVGALVGLTELNLTGNRLCTLPGELRTLSALAVVDVSDNCFVTLPPVLAELPALHTVRANANCVETFPLAIAAVPTLRCLELASNALATLPDAMHRCAHLRRLSLAFNALRALPPSMCALDKVEALSLDGNPLHRPPLAYVQEVGIGGLAGWARHETQLRAYYRQRDAVMQVQEVLATAAAAALLPPHVLRAGVPLQVGDLTLPHYAVDWAAMEEVGGWRTLATYWGDRALPIRGELPARAPASDAGDRGGSAVTAAVGALTTEIRAGSAAYEPPAAAPPRRRDSVWSPTPVLRVDGDPAAPPASDSGGGGGGGGGGGSDDTLTGDDAQVALAITTAAAAAATTAAAAGWLPITMSTSRPSSAEPSAPTRTLARLASPSHTAAASWHPQRTVAASHPAPLPTRRPPPPPRLTGVIALAADAAIAAALPAGTFWGRPLADIRTLLESFVDAAGPVAYASVSIPAAALPPSAPPATTTRAPDGASATSKTRAMATTVAVVRAVVETRASHWRKLMAAWTDTAADAAAVRARSDARGVLGLYHVRVKLAAQALEGAYADEAHARQRAFEGAVVGSYRARLVAIHARFNAQRVAAARAAFASVSDAQAEARAIATRVQLLEGALARYQAAHTATTATATTTASVLLPASRAPTLLVAPALAAPAAAASASPPPPPPPPAAIEWDPATSPATLEALQSTLASLRRQAAHHGLQTRLHDIARGEADAVGAVHAAMTACVATYRPLPPWQRAWYAYLQGAEHTRLVAHHTELARAAFIAQRELAARDLAATTYGRLGDLMARWQRTALRKAYGGWRELAQRYRRPRAHPSPLAGGLLLATGAAAGATSPAPRVSALE